MIDIIIVNWNSGQQLRACVESVIKFSNNLVNKVIVIDNGSIDGSEIGIENLSGVMLIRAGENLGFGKACNLGAKQASSEYLLFLNPDAALHPNTLLKALFFMQNSANDKVGICGVQLLDEKGHVSRSCARFPSAAGFTAHAIGLDRLLPELGHFMAEWDHSTVRYVDHVIGAFFLVRHELFEVLNGFDEQFFVYLEDLDFSYRAHQAGWKSIYLTEAQAFHAGGGTSNQVKALRLFYSLRSRLLYARKHFSLTGLFFLLLATLLIEPLSRLLLALARRSWSGFKETCSAYVMLWRWLPQLLFKKIHG